MGDLIDGKTFTIAHPQGIIEANYITITMAKTFYINEFLRHVDIDLLKSYYDSNKIGFSYDSKLDQEEKIDHILKHFSGLDEDVQDLVITQLSQVNELAAYAGTEMLKVAAEKSKIKLPENFGDFPLRDAALWFYMNEDALFTQTATKYELQHAVDGMMFSFHRRLMPKQPRNELSSHKSYRNTCKTRSSKENIASLRNTSETAGSFLLLYSRIMPNLM